MKTLRRYITTAFATTFVSTVVVFTFVVSIGGLFRLTDLITRGVPAGPIFRVFLSALPQALSFAIPISAITATLLVFGRLSADSEITAMRACGISLWRILGWMMPPACILLVLCVYINSELVPQSHYARRTAVARLGAINPVELIEEGRTIREFEGISLYVERKKGRELHNVRIFDHREEGRTREIKAQKGVVEVPEDSYDLVLRLESVTVDPFSFEHPGKADAARWTVRIPNARRSATYHRRDKDKTLPVLLREARTLSDAVREQPYELPTSQREMGRLARLRVAFLSRLPSRQWEGHEEARAEAMRKMVEFHKRLALASSSFAFIFLGVPLGIRSHRKESSIGIGLGLVIVYAFYMFILVAEQLAGRPAFRPDLLNWIPVALALLLGWILIRRLR